MVLDGPTLFCTEAKTLSAGALRPVAQLLCCSDFFLRWSGPSPSEVSKPIPLLWSNVENRPSLGSGNAETPQKLALRRLINPQREAGGAGVANEDPSLLHLTIRGVYPIGILGVCTDLWIGDDFTERDYPSLTLLVSRLPNNRPVTGSYVAAANCPVVDLQMLDRFVDAIPVWIRRVPTLLEGEGCIRSL